MEDSHSKLGDSHPKVGDSLPMQGSSFPLQAWISRFGKNFLLRYQLLKFQFNVGTSSYSEKKNVQLQLWAFYPGLYFPLQVLSCRSRWKLLKPCTNYLLQVGIFHFRWELPITGKHFPTTHSRQVLAISGWNCPFQVELLLHRRNSHSKWELPTLSRSFVCSQIIEDGSLH